jgi:hypothetical protein
VVATAIFLGEPRDHTETLEQGHPGIRVEDHPNQIVFHSGQMFPYGYGETGSGPTGCPQAIPAATKNGSRQFFSKGNSGLPGLPDPTLRVPDLFFTKGRVLKLRAGVSPDFENETAAAASLFS